jgi:two-component system phosphate regulon response regulator PhoB
MYDDSLDEEPVGSGTLKAAFEPHVLLVEDEEQQGRNIADLLRLDGYEVTRVRDGAAALARARAGGIDAVVLDVMLPGLDGFEVCRQLRADPETSRLIVVMLTALGDTSSKLEGLEGGADDYLVKPVVSSELSARLRKHLENRSARAAEVRRQRLQAIGEIAAAVSHEINNPLAAALGIVEFLLLAHGLPAGIDQDLRRCQSELLRIGQIVARLSLVEDKTVPYLGDRNMVDLRVM